MLNKSGIYSITFGSNEYIGSASNFSTRRNRHLHDLRMGKHHNIGLQRAYLKYGEVEFSFKVLVICDKKDLVFYEQILLESLNPKFNISKQASSPMLGRTHSNESIVKMQQAIRKPYRMSGIRKPVAEETKVKQRLASCEKIKCVEKDIVFQSAREASLWCISLGLTKSPNSRININKATQGKMLSAYGFHWVRLI